MDLQSYIQLKEAYVNLHAPKVELTEEEVWSEVEDFANALVEEHEFDLSEFTWEEILEAYSECSGELLEFIKWGGGGGGASDADIAAGKKREAERRAAIAKKSKEERTASKSEPASKDQYADGVVGQFQRLGDKMSGNQNRATKAKEYETSVNNIRTRNTNAGTGTRNSKVSQNDIDAETKGRAAQTASSNKPEDKQAIINLVIKVQAVTPMVRVKDKLNSAVLVLALVIAPIVVLLPVLLNQYRKLLPLETVWLALLRLTVWVLGQRLIQN